MSSDQQSLVDILVAARLLMSYVSGKTQEEFLADPQCQDAVIRRLEIIGEASRRISAETRARIPELNWKDLIAMRNFMIHEYDEVDLTMVWDTVQNSVPAIIRVIEPLLPLADERK
jgi:uncharacterized protein with HEPN domain